jgi:hypothetical protein
VEENSQASGLVIFARLRGLEFHGKARHD